MAHDAGECATAAAAAKMETLMALSSTSTTPLEDVAKAGGPGGVRWYQLYVYKVGVLTRRAPYASLAAHPSPPPPPPTPSSLPKDSFLIEQCGVFIVLMMKCIGTTNGRESCKQERGVQEHALRVQGSCVCGLSSSH